PTNAPIEQPEMTSGTMPSPASARNTPRCAQPRAAPLPSATPTTGARCLRATAGMAPELGAALLMRYSSTTGLRRARSSAQAFGVKIMDIAIGDPHPHEIARHQTFAVGNDHQPIDFRRVPRRTGERPLLIDFV